MLVCYATGHNALTPLRTICGDCAQEPKEINGPQAISNYQINKKANGGCHKATVRDEVYRETHDLFYKIPDT